MRDVRVDARRARRRRDSIERRRSSTAPTGRRPRRRPRDGRTNRARGERVVPSSFPFDRWEILILIHSRIDVDDGDGDSRANDGDDVLDRANRGGDERVSRVVVAGETRRARRDAR